MPFFGDGSSQNASRSISRSLPDTLSLYRREWWRNQPRRENARAVLISSGYPCFLSQASTLSCEFTYQSSVSHFEGLNGSFAASLKPCAMTRDLATAEIEPLLFRSVQYLPSN